jgi:regulator of cell morphogenesis and NO signaling
MNARWATPTVGEIVATDFRAAAVFEQFGIDFCCGGRQSLDEACRSAAINQNDVVRALEALPPATAADADNVAEWRLDRLIDHIISTHHAYVRSAMPTISQHLNKLLDVHGSRNRTLAMVATCFDELVRDLSQHMLKEEQVLFPYIRELAMTTAGGRHVRSPFGTIENPIRMMEREHRQADDALEIIRQLTNNYVAPASSCATYSVCMAELERFESDLHRHVHLENNVLFRRAIALENGYQINEAPPQTDGAEFEADLL